VLYISASRPIVSNVSHLPAFLHTALPFSSTWKVWLLDGKLTGGRSRQSSATHDERKLLPNTLYADDASKDDEAAIAAAVLAFLHVVQHR